MTYARDVAKGDSVLIKLGESWHPATATWIGDQMIYAQTEDGAKHKVPRFVSTLRKVKA